MIERLDFVPHSLKEREKKKEKTDLFRYPLDFMQVLLVNVNIMTVTFVD